MCGGFFYQSLTKSQEPRLEQMQQKRADQKSALSVYQYVVLCLFGWNRRLFRAFRQEDEQADNNRNQYYR